MVKKWDASFNANKDEITTICKWIRLSNLQPVLAGHSGGEHTLQATRGEYARICVELDISKALRGAIMVNGEPILVEYEGLSEICIKCGRCGHLADRCFLTRDPQPSGNAQGREA
ncbi:hypothetical protein V2J09_008581 [Rumex salicifolius]